MKSYERWARFLLICCMLVSLSTQRLFSQSAVATSTEPGPIVLAFPLRIDDHLRFQELIAAPGDSPLFFEALRTALSASQVQSNGNPYAEALSLDRLLGEALRTQGAAVLPQSLGVDIMESQLPSSDSGTELWSMPGLAANSAVCFTLYEILDDRLRFCVKLYRSDGARAIYMSEAVAVFDLAPAAERAARFFLEKSIIASGGTGAHARSSETAGAALPKIQPWKNQSGYEAAQRAFRFGIGGSAISVGATFVAAGIWQMYREAAYRNSAFNNATTLSGIIAGTCGAVTAVFLTFTVTKAAAMLRLSQ